MPAITWESVSFVVIVFFLGFPHLLVRLLPLHGSHCRPELGPDFQFKLHDWGIHPTQILVKHPQANAICERMHQTVGNLLRVFVHYEKTIIGTRIVHNKRIRRVRAQENLGDLSIVSNQNVKILFLPTLLSMKLFRLLLMRLEHRFIRRSVFRPVLQFSTAI